ncbi:kinase-like domain-containing protein, partial [Tribonema minus]
VASALLAVHASGYAHNDVKPGNLMRTRSGSVKLGDFGSATRLPGSPASCAAPPAAAHGTPAFMSPEACSGRGGTEASDVWSLTATLSALVFGRLPFACDGGEGALAERIMYGSPRYDDGDDDEWGDRDHDDWGDREESRDGAPDRGGRGGGLRDAHERANLLHLLGWGLSKLPAARPSLEQFLAHPWAAAGRARSETPRAEMQT